MLSCSLLHREPEDVVVGGARASQHVAIGSVKHMTPVQVFSRAKATVGHPVVELLGGI